MAIVIGQISLESLEQMEPQEMLAWAVNHYGPRAALFTSFQETGCALIDMAAKQQLPLRVVTVDTHRLHPETYELMEVIESRYGIRIERFYPDPDRLQRMIQQHGEYLFFDSKEKQEFCCRIRKVEPNERALATVDVWITGLRQDQSSFRAATPKASFVNRGGGTLLKLCPLADWTEEHVRAYNYENNVPKNKLYDQGYASIGCIICSTPIRPGEDKRAGRWRWFNQFQAGDKKECGIHIAGSGI